MPGLHQPCSPFAIRLLSRPGATRVYTCGVQGLYTHTVCRRLYARGLCRRAATFGSWADACVNARVHAHRLPELLQHARRVLLDGIGALAFGCVRRVWHAIAHLV